MAWIARSHYGELYIFSTKPDRGRGSWRCKTDTIKLPMEADYKLIGHRVLWKDEPVEI